MPDVTPTREVDALKEVLDSEDLKTALDFPTPRLEDGSVYLIVPDHILDFIKAAARGYLRLLTEGREIRWCEEHAAIMAIERDALICLVAQRQRQSFVKDLTFQPCSIVSARLLIEGDQ